MGEWGLGDRCKTVVSDQYPPQKPAETKEEGK